MTPKTIAKLSVSLSLLSLGSAGNVTAQEVLPRPDPPFKGTIGQTYKDSTPDKIPLYIDKPGDGVLVAAGGRVGGYTLFVKNGTPIYEYNWFAMSRYRVTSSEKLPAGKSTVRVEFKYDGGGLAKGGTVTMFLNDQKVGEGRVDKTIFARFSADETFDTGLDTGSPVSDQYQSPFTFSGTLKRNRNQHRTNDSHRRRPEKNR
jgi:hypothetical protein